MTKITAAQTNALRESIDALVRVFKIIDAQPVGDSIKLTPADIQTIGYIAHNPNCTASDVGRLLGAVPTTISAIIDRLARKGLVARSRTEQNRRIVQLNLTKAGDAVHNGIVREQNQHCRTMLKALTPEERTEFIKAMEKIAAEIS